MGVPKQRKTKSRQGNRRSHHALKAMVFAHCAKCGKEVLPHTMCDNCGNYRGREVVNVFAKLVKKERKRRERVQQQQQRRQQRQQHKSASRRRGAVFDTAAKATAAAWFCPAQVAAGPCWCGAASAPGRDDAIGDTRHRRLYQKKSGHGRSPQRFCDWFYRHEKTL